MTIFLDLDGTLLNVKKRYFIAHCKSLGTPPVLSLEAYWKLKTERITEEEIIKRHYPEVDPKAYLEKRHTFIEDPGLFSEDSLHPGALETLELLRKKADLVIVTLRRSESDLKTQLETLGITNLFSHVLTQSPHGDPAKVKAELMRLHAKHGDWMVGDTEADIGAGKLLELRTCGVLAGIRSRSLMETYKPDVIIETLEEFTAVLG